MARGEVRWKTWQLVAAAALALILGAAAGASSVSGSSDREALDQAERKLAAAQTVADDMTRKAGTLSGDLDRAIRATSTTRATLPTTTTTRPTDYAMGSTLTITPGDHKVTVYTYKAPVTSDNRFTQPKAGFIFAAVDIQQCAGSGGDRFGPNRFDWELAMPDNTRLKAGSTVVEPQLGSSPLAPGDCIRGWVSFEVPTGDTPRHVVYNEVTTGGAKWRVA